MIRTESVCCVAAALACAMAMATPAARSAADGPIAFVTNRDGNYEYYPEWSPDGRWIAYCAGTKNTYNLWKMRPDGSGREQLTNETARNQAPAWRR